MKEPLNPEPEDPIESWIHARLSRLPNRTAPATLVRQVMERIDRKRSRSRRWRSIHPWPWSLRLMLGTAAAAAFHGLTLAMSALQGAVMAPDLAPFQSQLLPLVHTVRVVYRAFTESIEAVAVITPLPVWYALITVLTIGYLLCISLVTLVWRITRRRDTPHP